VRFQVLTAAIMKFRLFWDVAHCKLVLIDRRFRGACSLHHHFIAVMMKSVLVSETSVFSNENSRRYIPDFSKLRVISE
jgi:hypothetical protein